MTEDSGRQNAVWLEYGGKTDESEMRLIDLKILCLSVSKVLI